MPSTLYTSNVASYELRDEVEKRELCCVTLIAGRPRRAAWSPTKTCKPGGAPFWLPQTTRWVALW